MKFIYPTRTARVTQKFGENFMWNGKKMYGEIIKNLPYHNGIDFGVNWNRPLKTEVLSVHDGTVTRIKRNLTGYGHCVYVSYGEYTMMYAHLQENSICVQVGEHIKQGQLIACMGNTGNSTSTHLHFELRKHGQWIDPTMYFQKSLIEQLMDYLKIMEQEVPKDQRVFSEHKGKGVLSESKIKALIEIAVWRMRQISNKTH